MNCFQCANNILITVFSWIQHKHSYSLDPHKTDMNLKPDKDQFQCSLLEGLVSSGPTKVRFSSFKIHSLSFTDFARPPCVLGPFPWCPVNLFVLPTIAQLPPFLLAFGYSLRDQDQATTTILSATSTLLVWTLSLHLTVLHPFFLEPNAYRSMVGRAVNSTQLAQDYTKLRTLLQSVRYYHRAHLYGPNAGRPRKNAILLLDGWVGK